MSTLTGSEPETAPVEPAEAVTTDGTARRGVLGLVLLVVVLALLGTTIWQGVRAWHRHQDATARTEAVAAARQLALNFVSISAKTIDRDLARVSSGATGDFADEFGRSKEQIKSVVVANKVDSRGEVLEAAVQSSDRDSAVVLVVMDATVVNAKAPKGQQRHYRIAVDVSKVDGAWRVATLQFVG
jgi:Mce-associated membrane protein